MRTDALTFLDSIMLCRKRPCCDCEPEHSRTWQVANPDSRVIPDHAV